MHDSLEKKDNCLTRENHLSSKFNHRLGFFFDAKNFETNRAFEVMADGYAEAIRTF